MGRIGKEINATSILNVKQFLIYERCNVVETNYV